jgi:hypothetical protein
MDGAASWARARTVGPLAGRRGVYDGKDYPRPHGNIPPLLGIL